MTEELSPPRRAPRARRRRTGRRGGDSGTRDAILDAALSQFAVGGFEATSMRSIATEAGVDPALVRHFYTDKETLFAQAMAQRTEIPARVDAALRGDPATVGRRLADAYFGLWEDDALRPVILGLARGAVTSPRVAEMFVQTMSTREGGSVPRAIPGDPRSQGFALAATHLLGAAIGRHVLELPVLVAMSHDELVDDIAPAIQHYLSRGIG